jgi:dipeptidase D
MSREVLQELIKDEETKRVWEIFYDISQIPRGSNNEKAVIEHLEKYAKQKGWEVEIDQAGNLLIKVKSENVDENNWVCLQAHADMVCVKSGAAEHDFLKDPIKWKKEEKDFVSANETTLGADNGIGIALALAIAENKELKNPNLEILITVDEETGLTGAFGLKDNSLKSKYLINIDSEDEGIFSIGCAGGIDCEAITKLFYTSNEKKGYEIVFKNLPGGHSGVNIHENHRVNAIQLLCKILLSLENVQLTSINGGQARNAIPDFAVVEFTTDTNKGEIEEILKRKQELFKELKFEIKTVELTKILSKEQTLKILRTLFALPSNVLEISNTVSDLVQTSCNFGTVKTKEDYLEAVCLLRSSNDYSKQKFASQIIALFELGDFATKLNGDYPGWDPNPDAEINKILGDTYKEVTGKDAVIEAIHAGLECGLIIAKHVGMQAISIGPTILGAHTPKEKVSISSVKSNYKLIVKTLEKMV